MAERRPMVRLQVLHSAARLIVHQGQQCSLMELVCRWDLQATHLPRLIRRQLQAIQHQQQVMVQAQVIAAEAL
jgi:hypothetical protein